MVVFQVEQQTSQCAITAPCFIGPSQNCLMSFTCSIRGGAAGGILQTWIVRNRSKDFCIREISLALQLWVQESVRGCEKKWSICTPLLFRSLWTELLLHTVSNHGSSHRQNRQGVAQANWSLYCLVGAVLFSLFAYRCFCYMLLKGIVTQGGWVFPGPSRVVGFFQAYTDKETLSAGGFGGSDALRSATCSTLQSILCCCSCFRVLTGAAHASRRSSSHEPA